MNELSALVRFVHLTAAILLAGGLSFLLFVARPAHSRAEAGTSLLQTALYQWQLRQAQWCLAILVASAALGLWLQAVNVSETSAGFFPGPSVLWPLLSETQFGKVWLVRLALLLFLALLFLMAARKWIGNESLAFGALGFALGVSLLVSLAFAGHAAAAEGALFALQIAVHGLHLLCGGLWLGGLVPLAFLLSECQRNGDASSLVIAKDATRRFSIIALLSVSALIATGGYNAWSLVGGIPPLFGTPYGKLLLIKIALLLPLLAIGAVNLLQLKPELTAATPDRKRKASDLVAKLFRNVTIEAALGVVVLLIVGHMSVTPPARHVQPDWPLSFRWDWSVLDKAPATLGDVQRGAIWATVAAIALLCALIRRRRRIIAAVIAIGAFGYAINVVHTALMIDAYPDTYKRSAVAYQAISVANGKVFYEDSGCSACHGPSGFGDGPAAADLDPKPPDLNGRHANAHTAGDLYWWLSHGVKPSSSMPGFSQSLSEEERWDLINYLRALSSGERARKLAPIIENEPWLVAPDFAYGLNSGESRSLKDHRGDKIVWLILLNLQDTEERLSQLANALVGLQTAGVEIIVVPNLIDRLFVADKLPGLVVSEGVREIADTYKLFARSFADENLITGTPHVEYLIDKQGYIRARWLPAESDGWKNIDTLVGQIDLLRKEKPRAPAPDDHVH